MRIVITDTDHTSLDVERRVAAARGVDLVVAQCRGGDYSLEPAQPLFRLRDRVFAVVGLGNIGADALSTMRRRTILVNTSRGPLVDTAALVVALSEGRIGGAALDVFEQEPLPPDSALWDLENVILTPHAARYGEESHVELKRRVVENVADACAGKTVRNAVNQIPPRQPTTEPTTAGAGMGKRA